MKKTTPNLNYWVKSISLFLALLVPLFANSQNPPPGITPCLIRSDCNAERMANPIKPYLWAEGDCNTGNINLNRYLSRSADVGGLTDLLNQNDGSNTECIPPYTSQPNTDYCLDNYCRTIQNLADLNIQMIQRAFNGATYHVWEFFPGERYYELGKQIIADINYAYDCAGNMRPVIQGMAFEAFDAANFDYAESVNGIVTDTHIPKDIVEKYFLAFPDDASKIDPLSGLSYAAYYNEPRFFKKERIAVPILDDQGNPSWQYDIQKPEMRMWFLYQAYTMIDMGYTSIHMGIYGLYGRSADGSYSELDQLTQAIRNYAQNNPNTGFVLLSGEPPMENTDGGLSAMHDGHFIFDFDSRAMRPREVNPGTSGDGNWPDGCTDPITNSILQEINSSPCSGLPQMAVVDPCTLASFGGTVSGYNAQGCYINQLPYTVHFDGFHPPIEPGTPSNGPSSLTWGFHDHQWFSSLPDACKAWWFDFFFCDRRNYHNGNGSIVIPGIIFYDSDLNNPDDESAMQLLADNPVLIDMLSDQTLAPKTPEMIMTEDCTQGVDCVVNCNGNIAPPGKKWLVGEKSYTITVSNKDCTSNYSIHIKGPDGKWLPAKIGDTYRIYPQITGVYEIHIRQDNLGLPSSMFGTREIISYRQLSRYCCLKLINTHDCGKMPRLTSNCVSTSKDKDVYDFVLESDYNTTTLYNVRTVSDFIAIENAVQVTPQKIIGRLNVRHKDVSELNLLVDVAQYQETFEPTLVRTALPACNGSGAHFRSQDEENPVLLSNENIPVRVFPNPTSGQVNIEFWSEQTEDVSVQILNPFGQVQYRNDFMAQAGDNTWTIDAGTLPNGCYMITLSSAHKQQCVRLVKQQ